MSASFVRADRIGAIAVSEIMQITNKAQELRRQGEDVIVLGAGEPDFDTPDHIKEAAARAMRNGATKYTPGDGTLELKTAVQTKFKRENGLDFALDELTITSGAKQVIFNAMMATLNSGDEVIIPAPYWLSYADIVQIAGGKPVVIPCDEATGFRLSAEALERAITPRTRWLMINSPSNPTGAAYSVAQYRPLLDVLMRHPHVWLLADDIYEHIVYDGFEFRTPAQIEPALKARTLTMNGVSKAYAMTGWRIGYAGGPRDLIKAMAVISSQVTSCASAIGQAAAVEALNGPQEGVAQRCAAFRERRDLVVNALNAIPGISCRKPEGAFYTYANCAGLIGSAAPDGAVISSDRDFTSYLLREAKVAVVPGATFGLAPYFRISYATSADELSRACERIAAACAKLQAGAPAKRAVQ